MLPGITEAIKNATRKQQLVDVTIDIIRHMFDVHNKNREPGQQIVCANDNFATLTRIINALIPYERRTDPADFCAILIRVLDQVARRLDVIKQQADLTSPTSLESIVVSSTIMASKLVNDLAVWNKDFIKYLPSAYANKMTLAKLEIEHLKQIGLNLDGVFLDLPANPKALHARVTAIFEYMTQPQQNTFEAALPISMMPKGIRPAALAAKHQYEESAITHSPPGKSSRSISPKLSTRSHSNAISSNLSIRSRSSSTSSTSGFYILPKQIEKQQHKRKGSPLMSSIKTPRNTV